MLLLHQLSKGAVPLKDRDSKMILQGGKGSWGIGLDNSFYRHEATPCCTLFRAIFGFAQLSNHFLELLQPANDGFDRA
jgi:hypothetical protein